MKYVYVVAQNKKEAAAFAEFGSESRTLADAHLKECREPPTDPYYGNLLHVYRVPAPPSESKRKEDEHG